MSRVAGFIYCELGLYETYLMLYSKEISEWYKPKAKAKRVKQIIRLTNE